MNIISYAQNFEDIMLWRALKHIEKGFYIDVGAWSPDIDSVTRLFYEHHWNGINLEPNPEFHSQLERKRPNDINLCIAVSDTPCSMEMNFLSNPGLSTLDDKIARKHADEGCEINKQLVEVTTLASICKNHIPHDQDIHFLKIDVEGEEEAVLRGNDWEHCRPWVVIAEATLPMSQKESFVAWENILLSANYQFAYADGLNRFYVSKEHAELLPAFKYPPNVFDNFELFSQKQANDLAQHAEIATQQAEIATQQAEIATQNAEIMSQRATSELEAAYNSHSWQITAPLRWLTRQKKLLIQHGFFARIKALIKKISSLIIRHGIVFIESHPNLHIRLVTISKKTGLYPQLRSIYLRLSRLSHRTSNAPGMDTQQPYNMSRLNPHARKIYAELKLAITKNKEEKANAYRH